MVTVAEQMKRIPSAVRPTVQAARRTVKAIAPRAKEIAYQSERNHQGIGNELIQPLDRANDKGPVRRRQRVGGMLNYYYRAA